MKKLPSEVERERINKRTRKTLIQAGKKIGRLTEAEKKTPSQKRSENARKKFANKAGVKYSPNVYPGDCWTCPKQPCGQEPATCKERTMVHPCLGCGAKYRHFVDHENPWTQCPKCREGAPDG
ncbi:MAG: hypothetical protein WC406_08300 [Methanoregula sp.]